MRLASRLVPRGALAAVAAAQLHGWSDKGGVRLDAGAEDRPAFWEKRQGEHAYLEDVLGEQAMAWVKTENERTVEKLGDPTAKPLYGRLLSILESKDKIPHLTKRGDYYYNFWQDAANPRGLLRRTTLEAFEAAGASGGALAWETVLDVDALGKAEGVSWVYSGLRTLADGSPHCENRVLLLLSRGGADAVVVREFNLASKAFVAPASGGFAVPHEGKVRVEWKDKDTLLLGTVVGGDADRDLTDSGYPRTVREWRRGGRLEDAPVVFEGDKRDVSVQGGMGRHRGWAFEQRVRATSFYTYEYSLRCAEAPAGASTSGGGERGAGGGEFTSLRLVLPPDASLSTFAGQAIVSLKATPWAGHAPGTLVAVDARALITAAARANANATGASGSSGSSGGGGGEAAFGALAATVLFKPSPRCSLAGWTRTKDYLIVSSLVIKAPRETSLVAARMICVCILAVDCYS